MSDDTTLRELEKRIVALEAQAKITERDPRFDVVKLIELTVVVVGVLVAAFGGWVGFGQLSATNQTVQLTREQLGQTSVQIDLQREQDYLTRRAQMLGVLFDRQEQCEASERDSASRCPHAGALRAREEAIRAFTQIERTQDWHIPALSLREVDLHGADLQGVDFRGADLRDADFRGADLRGALFQGATLTFAQFSAADLRRARFDCAELRGVTLSAIAMDGASFMLANLQSALLVTHSAFNADFRWANLEDAGLGGRFSRAVFWYALLLRTEAVMADLSDSDFTAGQLEGADLRGSLLARTRFDFADVTGAMFDATGLSQTTFHGTRFVPINPWMAYKYIGLGMTPVRDSPDLAYASWRSAFERCRTGLSRFERDDWATRIRLAYIRNEARRDR